MKSMVMCLDTIIILYTLVNFELYANDTNKTIINRKRDTTRKDELRY